MKKEIKINKDGSAVFKINGIVMCIIDTDSSLLGKDETPVQYIKSVLM